MLTTKGKERAELRNRFRIFLGAVSSSLGPRRRAVRATILFSTTDVGWSRISANGKIPENLGEGKSNVSVLVWRRVVDRGRRTTVALGEQSGEPISGVEVETPSGSFDNAPRSSSYLILAFRVINRIVNCFHWNLMD